MSDDPRPVPELPPALRTVAIDLPVIDLRDDPDATAETRALFANLRSIAPEAVLFGHQDDLAYGVTWKREPGRSDVHDVP